LRCSGSFLRTSCRHSFNGLRKNTSNDLGLQLVAY
jgi:hypothetical protein